MLNSTPMIADKYVWFVWSIVFLVPWLLVYAVFPRHRKAILWASLFTLPFGLTEPLFVPSYWTPPSLFDLAARTRFDIESFIFCFGIGGIGAVLFNVLTGRELSPVSSVERTAPHHRLHRWALAVPFVSFPILYIFPWNPIYPAIVAMALGASATILCRPDLAPKVALGAFLFVVYYAIFLLGLEWTAPGFIGRVWNIEALSGIAVAGLPIEELLFAAAFGAYWSGLYEHFTWRRLAAAQSTEPKRPHTMPT